MNCCFLRPQSSRHWPCLIGENWPEKLRENIVSKAGVLGPGVLCQGTPPTSLSCLVLAHRLWARLGKEMVPAQERAGHRWEKWPTCPRDHSELRRHRSPALSALCLALISGPHCPCISCRGRWKDQAVWLLEPLSGSYPPNVSNSLCDRRQDTHISGL